MQSEETDNAAARSGDDAARCLSPTDPLLTSLGCFDINRLDAADACGLSCDGRFRSVNQDRIVLHDSHGARLVGVFDGHGVLGENAALISATTIAPFVFGTGQSLSRALMQVHDLLVSIANHEHRRDPQWAYDYGTTAAVAKIAGDVADLAWIGDSRIAIFEENARTRSWSWQWSSRDHNPRTNEDEFERLALADARVVEHGGVRIFPGHIMGIDEAIRLKLTLNMSRALGHRILTKHGVLAAPEVVTRRLSQTRAVTSAGLIADRCADGSQTCIVCASDGIWDVLDERDVAMILSEMLPNGVQRATEAILLKSDKEWIRECSGDNMSVVLTVVRPGIS